MNLPLQRARVHHRTDIMYCNIFEEFDFTCFDVDFHDGDMGGVTHNRIERTEVFAVFGRRRGIGMVVGKAALQAALYTGG